MRVIGAAPTGAIEGTVTRSWSRANKVMLSVTEPVDFAL
jgi:hypothetical protein